MVCRFNPTNISRQNLMWAELLMIPVVVGQLPQSPREEVYGVSDN